MGPYTLEVTIWSDSPSPVSSHAPWKQPLGRGLFGHELGEERRTGVAGDNGRDHNCSVAGEHTGPDQPSPLPPLHWLSRGHCQGHATILCTGMPVGTQESVWPMVMSNRDTGMNVGSEAVISSKRIDALSDMEGGICMPVFCIGACLSSRSHPGVWFCMNDWIDS